MALKAPSQPAAAPSDDVPRGFSDFEPTRVVVDQLYCELAAAKPAVRLVPLPRAADEDFEYGVNGLQ